MPPESFKGSVDNMKDEGSVSMVGEDERGSPPMEAPHPSISPDLME